MPRVCIHLDQSTDEDYAYVFSGNGVEYALVCRACHDDPGVIEANLKIVTAERFAQIEEDACWSELSIIGRPEVLERRSGLKFEHEEILFSGRIFDGCADARPIPSSTQGDCLVLDRRGDLFWIDPSGGSIRRLTTSIEPGKTTSPGLSLHVSPEGDMAAVVEARGRYGIVLDLETGRVTMRLDRGDYYSEQSDFPVAFFVIDGRLRLVHGTDWNCLHVSDPTTGRRLTERSPTSYRRDEDERPEHYLDYFHGRLVVSPGGDWVVDDGWGWHPVGIVVSWSLRRWVEENRWESEDGPSKRKLAYRDYFWNGPLCWIDERTAVVWGFGNDDGNLIPAALLFDVETGRRVKWFAGPVGTLVYDRYLFASSIEAGTSVWDVETGEQLLHDGSFLPTVYHPGARRFVTNLPDGRFRLSRLVES